MKKRLYFVQIGYLQSKAITFPYAAGVLLSYISADEDIRRDYEFGDIVFMRTGIEEAVKSFEKPDIVGFSCYVWNFEYNKRLARAIKEAYPECIILFGGHHVAPGGDILSSCEYVDYLLHGEGEETLLALLKAIAAGDAVESVPNISYRKDGKIYSTPYERTRLRYDTSPYLDGCFDKMMREYPDIEFQMLIETNRGCPYGCTYCDWGRLKQKMLFFSQEKTFREIDWAAKHGIEFIGIVDSNFGMFSRDVELTEYIVSKHRQTGAFCAVQASYDKRADSHVFRISEMLNAYSMSKGITLSFQSLSEEVLKNVGRENLPMADFEAMLKRYNEKGIPTYSELILGLPGETYDSFVGGIEKLLDAGQHGCIYIHNCELLPCSAMAQPEYMEKFGIRASTLPINQPHRDLYKEDTLTEYSRIVTSTCSMSRDDWVRMNLYATVIQCFHFAGILKLAAVYLHYRKGVSYTDFYGRLINYIENGGTGLSACFEKIKDGFVSAALRGTELTFVNEKLPITLSADEYLILKIMEDYEGFFGELLPFLEAWDTEDEEYRELISFQRSMVKRPQAQPFEQRLSRDLAGWFDAVFGGHKAAFPEKREVVYRVRPKKYTFEEYFKQVIWYGKKTEDKTYLSEIRHEGARE